MSTEVMIGISFLVIGFFLVLFFVLKNNKVVPNSNFIKTSRNQAKNTKGVSLDADLDSMIVERDKDGNITLRQRIKYAGWKLSSRVFNLFRILSAVIFFLITHHVFSLFLSSVMAFVGWGLCDSLLTRSINKRFKSFDRDFATFLQSIVSLLKSGMNNLSAIGVSADNLEENSYVRQEANIMLQRLKAGVGEEKSISRFAEAIDHSEIELFVQAMILGNKLGGSLSQTLDRISEQVRKKKYFRESAISAVGLQKGSLWIIMLIFGGILVMMMINAPQFIDHLKTDSGKMVVEGGIFLNLLGIYWIKQIVKIKI